MGRACASRPAHGALCICAAVGLLNVSTALCNTPGHRASAAPGRDSPAHVRNRPGARAAGAAIRTFRNATVLPYMSRTAPLVFVMAAGLGTRMKSDLPKVLHRIAGRPMLHWVVTAARAAGAGRVVAILGHKADVVRASLDASFGAGSVDVAIQAEQRGTGHAVQCALPAVASEPDDRMVVILSGDAPLLASERIAELVAAAEASPAGMALLSTVPPR